MRDVMTETIVTVRSEATVKEAAKLMRESDVGTLPVVQTGNDVEGVVTDRDLVLRSMALDLDPGATLVRDVMTSGAAYCYDDDDIGGAAKAMVERGVRRVLVFERETDELKGILSLSDLAVRIEDPEASALVLHDIMQRRKAA